MGTPNDAKRRWPVWGGEEVELARGDRVRWMPGSRDGIVSGVVWPASDELEVIWLGGGQDPENSERARVKSASLLPLGGPLWAYVARDMDTGEKFVIGKCFACGIEVTSSLGKVDLDDEGMNAAMHVALREMAKDCVHVPAEMRSNGPAN
jgi:hypothetical protein